MNSSQSRGGSHSSWPLVASSLLFAGLLAITVAASVRVCQGHFGYPLDDTYIHMAMAKNFALHGVWGITRYGFSSSTSSPLYTLLVSAVYAFTGVREITPLVLNVLAGFALLAWCNFVFQRRSMPFRPRLVVLCFLVLAIPLYTLVHIGMEHVLHTLLSLIFLHLSCNALLGEPPAKRSARAALLECNEGAGRTLCRLASPEKPSTGERALLIGIASLLVVVRYEGMFLIAAAGMLFLFRRMWTLTAGLALASVIPLAIYGWISVAHGWYAIPNSLMLKANLPGSRTTRVFGSFGATLWTNFTVGGHIVLLLGLAAVLIYAYSRNHGSPRTYGYVGLILFASAALMHLLLARVGWFYRYESYLIACGTVTIAVAIYELGAPAPSYFAWCGYIIGALFILIIAYRTYHATYRAPQAVSDIYDQQYQMGLFVQQNLTGKTIVLNDIGAVSFLSDVKVLDLIGLGSVEPVGARLDTKYSTDWLEAWCLENNAAAAITYLSFAAPQWTRVEKWTIPGNYMSGSDTVGIYAVDPVVKDTLVRDLAAFRPHLPRRVIVQK